MNTGVVSRKPVHLLLLLALLASVAVVAALLLIPGRGTSSLAAEFSFPDRVVGVGKPGLTRSEISGAVKGCARWASSDTAQISRVRRPKGDPSVEQRFLLAKHASFVVVYSSQPPLPNRHPDLLVACLQRTKQFSGVSRGSG